MTKPTTLANSSSSMPRRLVVLFSCMSGASVANVYFAQPLLDTLAVDFRLAPAVVGGVVTATQAGSVLALLLLVPLGDRYDRRKLVRLQLGALVLALAGVAVARSTLALMAGMLAVGLLGTAMTQGMIAYAASSAGPHERGRVVGAAQAGVVIGLLLARVGSGVIADWVGWRGVYVGAAFAMAALGALIWRQLPVQTTTAPRLPYLQLVRSMWGLLRTDGVLRTRGILALLMFAVFSIFWSALTLELTAPPSSLSHAAVGAFGLLGALGAVFAGRAGQWADRGWGQRTSAVALTLLLLAWIPLSFTASSLWWLACGILLLDAGSQALHVTNQAMILRGPPPLHGRLIGCYMLFYAVGSGLGAIASTMAYAQAGWLGVCMLGSSVSVVALAVWGATLRRRQSCAECVAP